MFKQEEVMRDQNSHQPKFDRNSINEVPNHHYEYTEEISPKTAQTASQSKNSEVITLADQIVIPEFSSMVFNELSAPKTDGLGSLLPPSFAIGRKRFNSSMLDIKKAS